MAVREQLHMAVQNQNMHSADTQQMTDQPQHQNAQPMLPAVSILEVVHQAPRLMELLTPEGVKALTATCTQLRQDFRQCVTTIRMSKEQDQAMLFAQKWPNLVMVVINSTFSVEKLLSADLSTPYLSDREWATMVCIEVEEFTGDPPVWRSGFKHSAASVVTASHQSSQDMDTKASGVVLARLATEWVARTRSIFINLTSESAYNPFKHLHMGNWPCLERMFCLGQHGNLLPVSCLWGEHSSNLQDCRMILCSLGAELIQSLVTTCPHLRRVSLLGCKIDTAALTCLSQARFSRLHILTISTTPLGLLGVRSLSSCDLPALQRLTLTGVNMSTLAAMHLAQGCWPNLMHFDLCDNKLNVEAVTYLAKGEWPLLQKLSLTWECVPEAAFAILGVVDACKQFENKTSRNGLYFTSCSLLRSTFRVWPRLNALTVQNAVCHMM